MNNRNRLLAVSAVVLLTAVGLKAESPSASDWPYTVEIFGSIGNGRMYNGDNLWGSGLDYGGGIGIRPFSGWSRRIGFEIEAAGLKKNTDRTGTIIIQNQTMDTAVSQRLDSNLMQGLVLYHFQSGAVAQPFVSFGIGRVRVDYSRTCEGCVFDAQPGTGALIPRREEWTVEASKTGITFGAGLKFRIAPHLSFRTQIQIPDTTPGKGINLTWLRLQIALGAYF
jgi:opacity protein-like surface antigen